MARFRLRGGLDFDFPNTTLAAGEAAVIVRNTEAFASRYGPTPRILGVYSNDNLANDSDHLVLEGALREPILDFTYQDNWYPSTDGAGFSLVIRNDAAPPTTWGDKASWRPSGALNGTPGSADPGEIGGEVGHGRRERRSRAPCYSAAGRFPIGAERTRRNGGRNAPRRTRATE